MSFKQFLEASDDLFRLAYSLGEIPREEVENLLRGGDYTKDYTDRRTFTKNFAWAVPCKEAIDAIKKYAREPIYDVLAGTGYWTKILKKAGLNVVASDIHKITNKNHYHQNKSDTGGKNIQHLVKKEKEKIIRRNALKVGYDFKTERLNGDIFLSWVPYQASFATDILEMLPIGTRVFEIGEGMGGCTGDASFHKYLCDNFDALHYEDLPNFRGIHDSLTVWEKIKNSPINQNIRGKNWYSEEEEE